MAALARWRAPNFVLGYLSPDGQTIASGSYDIPFAFGTSDGRYLRTLETRAT